MLLKTRFPVSSKVRFRLSTLILVRGIWVLYTGNRQCFLRRSIGFKFVENLSQRFVFQNRRGCTVMKVFVSIVSLLAQWFIRTPVFVGQLNSQREWQSAIAMRIFDHDNLPKKISMGTPPQDLPVIQWAGVFKYNALGPLWLNLFAVSGRPRWKVGFVICQWAWVWPVPCDCEHGHWQSAVRPVTARFKFLS